MESLLYDSLQIIKLGCSGLIIFLVLNEQLRKEGTMLSQCLTNHSRIGIKTYLLTVALLLVQVYSMFLVLGTSNTQTGFQISRMIRKDIQNDLNVLKCKQ
jgi:hypothetical protein